MDKLKNARATAPADLTLDDIRTVNALPKVPLADLDRAAARADVLAAEAKADRTKLDAARPALLLTGTDAQLGEHDDAAAAFARTGERAAALATALRGRAEVVRGEMVEAARVERYDAAAVIVKALPAAVEADYRELVRLGRGIVEQIARAHAAVADVNSDLPAGHTPLPWAESFRQEFPNLPDRVVDVRRSTLWVHASGQPMRDQRQVQVRPDGTGFIVDYEDGDRRSYSSTVEPQQIEVKKKVFIDFKIKRPVSKPALVNFADAMVIPPLMSGELPGWSRSVQDGGLTSPNDVLRRLAELSTPPDAPADPYAFAPEYEQRLPLDEFEHRHGSART